MTAAHYAALPHLVRAGEIAIDVVLVPLAPDGAGQRLTLQADHVGDAIPRARVVVAEINERAPCTFGEPGIGVTNALLGSERLYRWAHRKPRLHLRASSHTHDVAVLGAIDNLYGINSALEVDLSGQINAEVAGRRHAGMVGGHADFLRGCLRSPGGRGIVALESTARGGTLSRIVAALAGGVVTSSRADADVVVTEYGVAPLRGRTLSQRAQALIAIAHPDFRAGLAAAAEQVL